jgi:hypothetical protein
MPSLLTWSLLCCAHTKHQMYTYTFIQHADNICMSRHEQTMPALHVHTYSPLTSEEFSRTKVSLILILLQPKVLK